MSRTVFRVSEINKKISLTLESAFSSVWIKGELSNFVSHSSGHWYFSLKEESAQIKGVMFKGSNRRISFTPEQGDEVLVRGRVSVYAPRGTYQIICEEMEQAGLGALQKNFEELKKKLEKQGWFDPKNKKPIPSYPSHIGVITSPTGAAIKDILQVLQRRFQGLRVTLIPALVQGEGSVKSLISALGQAEMIPSLDVVIIGRGGGSLEDLWSFNNEDLARAIHHFSRPIISAVGHEIDFTICDFVSDLRAPTPSAAAELVVKNSQEILLQTRKLKNQLISNLRFHLQACRQKILSLEKLIPSPKNRLQELQQRADDLSRQLQAFTRGHLKTQAERMAHINKLVKSLNPRQIMQRGFCLATGKGGKLIKDSKDIRVDQTLSLEFFKGRAEALVTKKG